MAGGTGQDVFKTPVVVKDVLSAEDVRSAEMAKTMGACVQVLNARPESLLSGLFGSREEPKFFGSGWTRREVCNELMLEFV